MAWFSRFTPRAPKMPPAFTAVETLETRALMSGTTDMTPAVGDAPDTAGPQVVAQYLLGSNKQATGIVVVFNESLNRATAEDIDAYVVLKKINIKGSDGSFFDQFIPIPVDTSTGDSSKVRKLRLDSAVYDDATHSVTITPHKPFRADEIFRQFRIAGQGNHAITDVAGNRLDGEARGRNGRNALIKYHARRGHKLTLKDNDGDKITIRQKGPGRLVSFTHVKTRAQPAPIIMIEGTDPTTTIITATVKKGRKGDGVFDLMQFTGTSAAQIDFLSNPAVRIAFTQP